MNSRPHLKFVVNYQSTGNARADFSKQRTERKHLPDQKYCAREWQRTRGLSIALRIMATAAEAMLKPYGKNIVDAIEFYLPHLQAKNGHAHSLNWSLNFCRPKRPMAPARLTSSI